MLAYESPELWLSAEQVAAAAGHWGFQAARPEMLRRSEDKKPSNSCREPIGQLEQTRDLARSRAVNDMDGSPRRPHHCLSNLHKHVYG